MGPRLLCWVALCLLGAGLVDAEVTQTPKYLIKARKQQATLKCSFISGHLSVYWYQQAQGQGPRFLITFYNGEEREKGDIPDRFSVKQYGNSRSELTMNALAPTDAALYLCASSPDTALHARKPPVQKPSRPTQEGATSVAATTQAGSASKDM